MSCLSWAFPYNESFHFHLLKLDSYLLQAVAPTDPRNNIRNLCPEGAAKILRRSFQLPGGPKDEEDAHVFSHR